MECNLCGGSKFRDHHGQSKLLCVTCFSLPRTRMLWAHIDRYATLSAESKVMHIAPEKGIFEKISKTVEPKNYSLFDIDIARYAFAGDQISYLDLCTGTQDLDDNSFDLIIHSHVLEHIPCNITYVLYELHRLLKPRGKHICVIPFLSGLWDETFATLPDAEATRRFGQPTHVRKFGAKDRDRSLGCVLKLPSEYDAEAEFGSENLKKWCIPERFWQGFHPATVLVLEKDDMLLLSPTAKTGT